MRSKSFLIILLFLGALGFTVFKLIFGRQAAVSGLKIQSTPEASVYLDDKLIGKTPYDGRHPSGNYILKLVADESGGSWQDKIVLTPQTLVYVKKDIGTSELTSSGDVVSMENIGKEETEISVTSTPDASIVSIDGMEKGISPVNVPVLEGEHDIVVNSTGFIGRTIKMKAVKGFRVNISTQLALSPDSPQAQPEPTTGETSISQPTGTTSGSAPDEPAKPYVIIKDTPTDFLRVRFDASIAASEVARLNPGDKVPFLEEKSGWFKVNYGESKEGWISSRYAEKVE